MHLNPLVPIAESCERLRDFVVTAIGQIPEDAEQEIVGIDRFRAEQKWRVTQHLIERLEPFLRLRAELRCLLAPLFDTTAAKLSLLVPDGHHALYCIRNVTEILWIGQLEGHAF